jgi:hypothetical protein
MELNYWAFLFPAFYAWFWCGVLLLMRGIEYPMQHHVEEQLRNEAASPIAPEEINSGGANDQNIPLTALSTPTPTPTPMPLAGEMVEGEIDEVGNNNNNNEHISSESAITVIPLHDFAEQHHQPHSRHHPNHHHHQRSDNVQDADDFV